MPMNSLPTPPPITLDQLAALNDEISALVRSGVPLETNLAEIGGDLPGTLGKITTLLAQRAGRGESLAKLIGECSAQFPPVYRAVIESGLRAGRLSAALESLSGSIRRLAETRRCIVMATLYPFLVVILVWLSFAFFSGELAPKLAAEFTALQAPGRGVFTVLAWIGHGAIYWGPGGPILLVILAALAWSGSRRATWIGATGLGRLAAIVPWFGPMLRCSRNATFADILALLVENSVPLPEALILASESSGDRQLIEAARQASEMIKGGQNLTCQDGQLTALPPLLRWLLPAASRKNILAPALKHAAEMYNRRAEYRADLLRMFTPVVLTVCVSGVITCLYALTVFIPYTTMLRALSQP
jgi:type II secretory pathway component PulF